MGFLRRLLAPLVAAWQRGCPHNEMITDLCQGDAVWATGDRTQGYALPWCINCGAVVRFGKDKDNPEVCTYRDVDFEHPNASYRRSKG